MSEDTEYDIVVELIIAEFVDEQTALLVLVSGPAMRDGLLGVLRGFQAEIVRTPLAGGDREALKRALLGREELD